MSFQPELPLQWQLVRVDLDPIQGSEQAGDRPCLIISREPLNEVLNTITVLPVTTLKPGRRVYETEVLLPAGVAGNPNTSIVLAHQIRTIDKQRVYRSYGRLEDEACRNQVRQAVRTYLDLE